MALLGTSQCYILLESPLPLFLPSSLLFFFSYGNCGLLGSFNKFSLSPYPLLLCPYMPYYFFLNSHFICSLVNCLTYSWLQTYTTSHFLPLTLTLVLSHHLIHCLLDILVNSPHILCRYHSPLYQGMAQH